MEQRGDEQGHVQADGLVNAVQPDTDEEGPPCDGRVKGTMRRGPIKSDGPRTRLISRPLGVSCVDE